MEPPNSLLVTRIGQFAADRAERRVVAAGGRAYEDPCRPTTLPGDQSKGLITTYTCACGGETRVGLPYQGEAGKDKLAAVCLVCDAIPMTPRFGPRSGELAA